MELTFSLVKRRQVSSAYNLKSQSVTADFISRPYNKKVLDPKWTLEELCKNYNKISVFQIRSNGSNHLTVFGENPYISASSKKSDDQGY